MIKFRLAGIAAVALCLLTATASAQGRPDTRAYSCVQVAGLVQSNQSIVLSTGRYTYARYVARRNYCGFTQDAHTAYVPTFDNPRCNIGYICKERLFD